MDNEETQQKFGVAVRAMRDRAGLSQEQLSFDSGLHRTYVGSVERGERNISLVNMEKIAGAFGLELWELVKRAGL